MKILSTTPQFNTLNTKNQAQKSFSRQQTPVTFKGAAPEAKSLTQKAISKMAGYLIKILDSKAAEKLVISAKAHPKIVDKLTSHLIVLGSTTLSGFYVLKTLNNKQMEESKRKTLAINQGLVWGVSTVMAYTFDGWARKQFTEKIINKFEKANSQMEKGKLKSLKAGMEIARPIIIVDMVYRFIAPVIVTPLANAIGNEIQARKADRLAKTQLANK